MRLQILINHYHESQEMVGRMLQSIAEQSVKSDFEVIIASDGTDNQLDRAFLETFPFSVQYHVLPHKGTRATRNALLDMSDADYLMFCDADDCFKGADGLSKLFDAANNGEPDVVSVPFIAEVKDEDGYRYKRMSNNGIWLQGKIFRRAYLLENQIRFDEVANHGDMSFLWMTLHLTKNIRYLQETFYVWKWNEKSTTRADPFYNIRTYDRMLLSYSRMADDMIKRERTDLYGEIIAGMISAAYIDSESGRWDDAPSDCVRAAKTAIADFIKRYRVDYENLDEKFRWRKYNATLVGRRTYGPSGKFAGITAWMDKIGAENE